MANKLDIPKNDLGPFLTLKDITSIDIHAKTGISTIELSQLRKGSIKSIGAQKLFLIAKAGGIEIKEMLENVYPQLKLRREITKTKITEFDDFKGFFEYIQGDAIQEIADKTGLTPYRLKNIKNNKVNPLAHELYLIELATKTKPGTLFNVLYKDLELNTSEEEARLRLLEKNKSSKKH
ncbi:hypothetical protein J7E50_02495 [Pedobacter sp. ISL-68]|uniref:hypothetical protein n=1 Tax=unclassified Pedobacter TaxID=2628915 RepID=UPI001BE93770|nr:MULTISPECIES: hypothetical protein [unclassified Pedobacter]MBT2560090.1 hypothetical protein [Pedobacter sp. ISL-64]MBT2589069.1 hypothetical protein [Pedobacter sp. ISL-68]